MTEAGAVVLATTRAVVAGIDDLRASVKGLRQGLEAEVTLVVDVMSPTARLVDAVQAFEAIYPTVKLRLHTEALSRWRRRGWWWCGRHASAYSIGIASPNMIAGAKLPNDTLKSEY